MNTKKFYSGSLNDADNASFFCQYYGENVRYCSEKKEWVMFDGKRWVFSTSEVLKLADNAMAEIAELVRANANRLEVEAKREKDSRTREDIEKRAEKLYQQAISLGNVKMRNTMLEKAMPELTISINEFDKYPYFLNVKNCVIDLSNRGKPIPHNKTKNFYLTKMAGIAYGKDGRCPKWLKSLKAMVSGNEELADYLQRACGYMLTGYVSEKCLMFLLGPSNSGKSVFSLTLQKILGDYAVTVPANTLMSMKFESQLTPHLHRLPGKRLAAISEAKITAVFDEGLLKSVTGGEPVSINPKYGIPYQFQPECKFLIVANDKPRVLDMSDAFWNRMHIVQLTNVIPIEDQRPIENMVNEFVDDEGAGILNWLIEGELKRRKNRLNINMPKVMIEARNEYRANEDVLGNIFSSMFTLDKQGQEKCKYVISHINFELESLGHRKVSSKKLTGYLQQKGVMRGGQSNMYYLGMREYTVPEKDERGLPVSDKERETYEMAESLFETGTGDS